METKICICCGKEKPGSEYYAHKQMSDGLLGKCKECCKAQAKARELILRQDETWVEKERARAREKHKRLNYSEKQKIWNAKRPWVMTTAYKNLHQKLGLTKEQTAHHWNYNFVDDYFIMDKRLHRKIHVFLTPDSETKCFFNKTTNELLDTREKHELFINSFLPF